MRNATRHTRVLPVAACVLVLTCSTAARAQTEPAAPEASLAVKVVGQPIAGVPVVLELTVTNTGKVPLSYWCGGPDTYPPAEWFVATVSRPGGQATEHPLSNGQFQQGSGGARTIEPGAAVTLPAAMDPLPAGRYTLQSVRGRADGYFPAPGKPMRVNWPATKTTSAAVELVVIDDAAAAERFARALLARVRQREPFARHLATRYRIGLILDAMLADLDSDDPDVVLRAAETLNQLTEFPDGLATRLRTAMRKHLRVDTPPRDALAYLAWLAGREGSDTSLEAVLEYIAAVPTRADGQPDRYRLQNLFLFKQPRAADALRGFLNDADADTRLTAAIGLSKRRDPAAVPVLVAASRDASSRDRRYSALYPLGDYPDDPRAVDAIRAAMADADERVREGAKSVMEGLERDRVRRRDGASP